jgi:hypothetical protein
MVLAHPPAGERKQRQPEQQRQIGDQDRPRHAPRRVQQVMVVHPVDADIGEAQDVGQEHRPQFAQRRKLIAMRNFHLQNHDGDDDGDHAIAECFQPALAHAIL